MTSGTKPNSSDEQESGPPKPFGDQLREQITQRSNAGRTGQLRDRLTDRWAADNTDKEADQ